MTANISQPDRIVRLLLGLALILVALLVTMSSILQIILIAGGAILLVTAALNFCPIYRIFNVSTRRS